MKFLVVISACLAVSSGHYHGGYPVGPGVGYQGPLADALPSLGLVGHPNGAIVPQDTPSVVAARAEHLAARGAAYAAAGPALVAAHAVPAFAPGPVGYAQAPAFAPYAAGYGAVPALAYAGYAGPLADVLPAGAAGLVAHPNGAVVPADTPSVVAARAEHLAARGAAYAAAAPVFAAGYGAGYGYGAGHGYGVPAVAAHSFAAPALGPIAPHAHAAGYGAGYGYGAGHGYGVPAVAAAPAFAAHSFAAPALGPIAPHAHAAGVIPVGAGSPTGALVTYTNGAVVPADEPAVVAARAQHFAAKGGLGW